MPRIRYNTKTMLTEFCEDGELIALLHQNGITTVGEFLQTPFSSVISSPSLLTSWDKGTELFFKLYKSISHGNIKL